MMYDLLKRLYPLNRVLVCDDIDRSLEIIREYLPKMDIIKVPTGTECWTWKVPEKWTVKDAYVSDGKNKLIDINDHILHVVSYSLPKDGWVSKEELFKHLHISKSYTADGRYQVPENPSAIPWMMKYYERDWGFCVQKERLNEFSAEKYYVKIDSSFEQGFLSIGDYTINGKSEKTIVIIVNTCHPAQANDSISGLVVAVKLAKEMSKLKWNYSYKFLFLPETIGSIAYLSQNEELISSFEYGIFIEMVGHDNNFVLQYSKQKNTKIDRVAEYFLRKEKENYRTGDFRKILQNDEGVFNGPGVNIPTISISRWPYPEYHSSLDTPDIINPERLEEAKILLHKILSIIDRDFIPSRKFRGPLFLSRYGLWVDWREHKKANENIEMIMMMMDEELSVFDIAEKLDMDFEDVENFLNSLYENDLIEKRDCISNE